MNLRLDHVHLRCRDLEASREFYQTMFKGREAARLEVGGMPIIRMEVGGVVLALSPPREGESPGLASENPGWGCYELGFLVDDVQAAYDELRALGAVFISGPREVRPGVQAAFMEAPDGVRIELLHRD